MATTCMLSIATAILENERKEWDLKVDAQYQRMTDAEVDAAQDPDDYGKQIMRVLEQDRLSCVATRRDVEMQSLLQDTRTYLARI